MRIQERYEELLRLMHESVEFDDAKLNTNSKLYGMVRMLISYQMHKDGYPYIGIGKCINRTHSIVLYAAKKWDDILSSDGAFNWYGFGDEYKVWLIFSDKVRRADERRGTPAYTKFPTLTLAEFREKTEDLPGSTILKITEESQKGAEMSISFDGRTIFLCERK